MIGKRGGRYYARLDVGSHQEWLGTFDTRQEAQEAESRAKNSVRSKETVASFAERWLRDYPRPKESTRKRYESNLSTLVNDSEPVKVDGRLVVLSKLRLVAVTRPVARAYVMRRKWLHATLRAMFADAVRDGLTPENPFANLRLPQSRGRKDIVPLTEGEVYGLTDCAHALYGPMFGGLVSFAAYVMARPGELFALEHQDVDVANMEVTIRRRAWRRDIDTPKSGKARRILLAPEARDRYLEIPRHATNPLVFVPERGTMFTASKLAYYWHPVRAAFNEALPAARRRELAEARGSDDMAFYELRHFGAHMLLERGATPEDVAFQLGHQDGGRLVRELYGHLSQSEATRERLRQAFGTNVRTLRIERSEAAHG